MKVNYEQIDILIERYYQCETSLEEEELLYNYFTSDNVAPNHKVLVPQFIYLKNNDDSKLSDNFDKKMIDMLNQKQNNSFKLPKVFHNLWKYSAAAVIMIGFGLIYYINSSNIEVTGNSELSEEDFAYKETMNAFQLISESLGSAGEHFQSFELLNRSLEQINQTNYFENLKYLDKIILKESK